MSTVCWTAQMQTEKTVIRLLLQEQSDLGLHCLPRPEYVQKHQSLRYFTEGEETQ